ncbi:MAG: YdeI/OmpD-associated family protein [Chloroflexi bacterium]|nr:YdeI/OmpD-associated family protein [Chloroflexota bacterium]
MPASQGSLKHSRTDNGKPGSRASKRIKSRLILKKALRRSQGALNRYKSLPHSRKKQLLRGLFTAKSEATRQRRIAAIVQEVTE